MEKKISFKGILELVKTSFKGFSENKVPKLSGSLAYCTVFSLGPLLIIIIGICGIFWGREAIEGKIYGQFENFMGHNTALQLQQIIKNASISGKGKWAATIGGITLLIGATSVFAEIQDSINTIWGLKPKPRKGWVKLLKNRFLSFSVIVSLGFLLLVSLAFSAVIEGWGNQMQANLKGISVVFIFIATQLLNFIFTAILFGIIFKVLPDAQIRWKDIIAGALVTAFLFTIGKSAISIYISKTNTGNVFGTAGSLVILLLWVYYSSIILYFGAEFTKVYAKTFGAEIRPSSYAVTTREVEVETNKKTV